MENAEHKLGHHAYMMQGKPIIVIPNRNAGGTDDLGCCSSIAPQYSSTTWVYLR